jgi:hypothetical protein
MLSDFAPYNVSSIIRMYGAKVNGDDQKTHENVPFKVRDAGRL